MGDEVGRSVAPGELVPLFTVPPKNTVAAHHDAVPPPGGRHRRSRWSVAGLVLTGVLALVAALWFVQPERNNGVTLDWDSDDEGFTVSMHNRGVEYVGGNISIRCQEREDAELLREARVTDDLAWGPGDTVALRLPAQRRRPLRQEAEVTCTRSGEIGLLPLP